MEKQSETASELDTILHERVERFGPLTGTQSLKIVRVEPPKDGANWTLSHSGQPGGFSDAIDRVQAQMKKEFELL